MKRRTFTPEEKAAWKEKRAETLSLFQSAKLYAEQHKDELQHQIAAAQAVFDKPISINSFAFVLKQMIEQGIEGTPYIHVRTFHDWRKVGRKVRKGQRSTLCSISYLNEKEKDETASKAEKQIARSYPTVAALFHFAQTDPLPDSGDTSPDATDTAQADEKEVIL